MTNIFYSKEFARFGKITYSLRAQCDNRNEYYTITVNKRLDGNVTARVTFSAKAMDAIFERIPHVFDSMRRERMWITMMEINDLLFHELFSANVYYLNHRIWIISALVRTEDRSIYIGLTDTGEMPEEISAATSNSSCSIYFTIEAIYQLLNAIEEALGAIDNRNEAFGGLRKLIG